MFPAERIHLAEPAKVIPLFPKQATSIPDRFSASEAEDLLRWAAFHGFTYEQVIFSVTTVRDWANSGRKVQMKLDWVATIRNAMRRGWALEGYKAERMRKAKEYSVRGTLILPKEHPITEALIQRHLARLREEQ